MTILDAPPPLTIEALGELPEFVNGREIFQHFTRVPHDPSFILLISGGRLATAAAVAEEMLALWARLRERNYEVDRLEAALLTAGVPPERVEQIRKGEEPAADAGSMTARSLGLCGPPD